MERSKTCDICGNTNKIRIPGIGISFGMYGSDYDFCEVCIKNLSLDEFWKIIFTDEGYAYPPKKKEEAPIADNSPIIVSRNNYSDKRKELSKQEIERRKMKNSLRYKVMRRDNFHCVLCGNTGKSAKLVVDHIVPIAKGGLTKMENLRTLCNICNTGKGTKTEKVELETK
jgi:hypothetical protein